MIMWNQTERLSVLTVHWTFIDNRKIGFKMKLSKMDDEKNDCDWYRKKDGGIEKVKTITVKQLYNFIKASNMIGYIESEAALIRMIRKMTEDRPAASVCFHFVTVDAKELTFKIHVKDLEN